MARRGDRAGGTAVSRGGAAFLVTAALLLVVGAGIDLAVTRHAERLASERVSAELGAPAEVELHGWPVSLRLLAGRVPEAVVVAHEVPLDGTRLARLEARLADVRVRFADLGVEAPAGALPAFGSGTFEAHLTEDALAELIGRPGQVRLEEGRAVLRVEGAEVEALPGVRDGVVVLRPTAGVVAPVEVALPRLPAGAVVERVGVSPGVLRLAGRVPAGR